MIKNKKESQKENIEWLKDQCNRYVNGQCSTLSCLRRGGYKVGGYSYDIATCNPHEIILKLTKLNKLMKTQSLNKEQ